MPEQVRPMDFTEFRNYAVELFGDEISEEGLEILKNTEFDCGELQPLYDAWEEYVSCVKYDNKLFDPRDGIQDALIDSDWMTL